MRKEKLKEWKDIKKEIEENLMKYCLSRVQIEGIQRILRAETKSLEDLK